MRSAVCLPTMAVPVATVCMHALVYTWYESVMGARLMGYSRYVAL